MDYCSSCRRHLNGALVCPGCGAYAPDIAPPILGTRTSPAASVERFGATVGFDGAEGFDRAEGYEGADGFAGALSSDPSEEFVGAPPAPEGRAARRRQRARWKKNQRRAVVATAVALVGGGLTVSVMHRQSGDRVQAATAPETMGTAEMEQPTQDTSPVPIRTDDRHSASRAQTPASGVGTSRHQYASTPHDTSPQDTSPYSTAHQSAQRQAAVAPRTAPLPATQQKAASQDSQDSQDSPASAATAGSRTGTAATPTPTPTPTDDGTSSGTTSQTSPPSQATPTSTPVLCLLGVCVS